MLSHRFALSQDLSRTPYLSELAKFVELPEEEVKEISCYRQAINEVPPAAEVNFVSIRYYRNALIHQTLCEFFP